MKPMPVLRTTTNRCATCGGTRQPTETLTTTEARAVQNGWDLATFRTAVARLTSDAPLGNAPAIPPAPSLYDMVRARDARGLTPAAAIVQHAGLAEDMPARPRTSVREDREIPPPPSILDRIRAAAGGR